MAGVVLQDVVADAMSTEAGAARPTSMARRAPKAEIDRDLGMVQILGRLALSLGAFLVAGLGGRPATIFSYETVFLIALVIPAISASGALGEARHAARRAAWTGASSAAASRLA